MIMKEIVKNTVDRVYPKIKAEPTKQVKNAFPEFPKNTLFFKLKYKKIVNDIIITIKIIEIILVKIINDTNQKIIVDAYNPFTPSIKLDAL